MRAAASLNFAYKDIETVIVRTETRVVGEDDDRPVFDVQTAEASIELVPIEKPTGLVRLRGIKDR